MATRREFITTFGAAITAIAVAPALVVESCAPTTLPILAPVTPPDTGPDGRIPVDVSDLSSANPAKVAAGLTGPDGKPVMVTRVSDTDFRALSSLCTHQNCQVNTAATNGYIICACHLSHFAMDGSVLQGPASSPLVHYDGVYDAANKQLRIKFV